MVIKLDLRDRKLLYELDIDSRQSTSQLGKKSHLSKQGVSLKINNYLKNGVITAFPSVLNISLMGFLSFRIYVKLIDISPKKEEQFRKYLVDHPDVAWLVGCEGIWDYIFVVFPKSFEEFENFSLKLNNFYGRYIDKKDLALVTASNHFRCGYLLGKKKNVPPMVYAGQPKKVLELDKIDKNILALLSKDARISPMEIHKKLKIAPKTASYRIDKMIKQNVIEGFTTSVDLGAIGFERYKILIRVKDMNEKREKEFIEYARLQPYVLYYSKSIGTNDVELELIVENNELLRKILADIREKFSDIIKSYEVLKIYKEFKLNYYPSGKVEK
jgi:DNA-binding Lrp family transcriptional regulator